MTTRILLLTGMTPDTRIFSRLLPLLPNATIVPWITPRRNESIPNYAERLADSLTIAGEVIVCGVSFGGIVARELALRLNAKACVLISSVRDSQQLPPWFRAFRGLSRLPLEPLFSAVGTVASLAPATLRTASTARLKKFHGQAGSWHRWASSAVLRWQPSLSIDAIPLTQIHGDQDLTFPIRYIQPDRVITGGGHVLPLTHPKEVAAIISQLAS
ncbi:alpha/beta fold hydrolase [Anatilimnocola sp. NA78]|uniref:alpha/beta fold hydrolase n=1 Tax=Anatilimnocola sp. NA78 TaxID=3415683 RepID=UPI003CE56B67